MAANDQSFTLEDLQDWVERGLLTPIQAQAIRAHLAAAGAVAERSAQGPERRRGFNFVTVAYYFGGFMILLAYTIFMGIQWQSLGIGGQAVITAGTVAVLWALGLFLRRVGYPTAGGLLVFAGTGIVPLAVYCLEAWTGLWPTPVGLGVDYRDFYREVGGVWVAMEVLSIVAAVAMLRLARFPLITLLIAFWTWYMSIDLARWIAGRPNFWYSEGEQVLSTLIGVAMLALGILLQRRTARDYSLWFYIFGHLVILGNLSWLTLDHEGWLGLLYPLTYLGFVVASVWLQRRVFLVFGAIGCYSYVSYLAFDKFGGAFGFPFALAGAGLTIILSAVLYQAFVRPWLERRLARRNVAVAPLARPAKAGR